MTHSFKYIFKLTWIYRYAVFTVHRFKPPYLSIILLLFFVKHLYITALRYSFTKYTLPWIQTFGKTSFKENMTTAALLRNEGANKTKVVTYYLNNGLWYGTMHLWILRKAGAKMPPWHLDDFQAQRSF